MAFNCVLLGWIYIYIYGYIISWKLGLYDSCSLHLQKGAWNKGVKKVQWIFFLFFIFTEKNKDMRCKSKIVFKSNLRSSTIKVRAN